jgi:hypothetical protein
MKSRVALAMFGALCALAFATVTLHSQEKAAPGHLKSGQFQALSGPFAAVL